MIAPTEIVNPMSLSELITCKICKGILKSPLQCSKCGNVYCEECFEDKKKCLNNCSKAPNSAPWLNHIIHSLKFKCKNGCEEIINFNDYEEHYLMKCSKLNYMESIPKLRKMLNVMNNQEKELKLFNRKIRNNNYVNNIGLNDSDYFKTIAESHPRWNKPQIFQTHYNRSRRSYLFDASVLRIPNYWNNFP